MFFDHDENTLNESIKAIMTAIESDLTMLFRNGDEILCKEDFNDTAKRCKIIIEGREKSFISTSNMYMQFIRGRNKHNKLYIKDRGELKLTCINEEKYKELPTCKVNKRNPIGNEFATIKAWLYKGRYDEENYARLKKIVKYDSKYMNHYRSAIAGLSEIKEIKTEDFNKLLSTAFDINNPQAAKISFLKKKITSNEEYDKYMSETFMLKDYARVKDFIKEVKENIYVLTEYNAVVKKIKEPDKYRFMCNYITVVTQYYLIIIDNIILAYTAKMEGRKKALDKTFEVNK